MRWDWTHPRSSDLCSSREQETTDILGVAVEVDNDRLISGKQAFESLLIQSMGMLTRLAKNQEIVNVDDSDSNTGISEKGSGGDCLEGHFDTTSDEDYIGVKTIFGRESFPDGCTCNAVFLGLRIQISVEFFLHSLPKYGLTSSTESQTPVGFLDPTIKLMLFLARRQWSMVLTLLLASAGK